MFQNQAERVKTGFWWLNQGSNLGKIFFYLTLLFLPTQFGRHFWPSFAYVYGIRIDYLSPTLYFTDLLITFLFFVTVFGKKKLHLNKALLCFFTFLLFTLLFLNYWQVGFYGFLKILEFSFLAIYCALLVFKKETFIKIITASFLLEALLAIWQFFNKGSVGAVFYFLGERSFDGQTPGIANASINGELILRPYATFPHPNVLAGFLLIVFTFIVFSAKKLKPFYLSILLIGAIALFLTFSRIAIFLLGTVILLKLLLTFKNKKKIYFNLFTYLVIFAVFLYTVFLSPFSTRFLNFSPVDSSLTQRYELISASYKMFLENPLVGVGLNSFLPSLPQYLPQKQTLFIQPVHNIYLLILSQLGLVGFSFFVFLFVKIFKKISKSKNYLLAAVLIEILILGFFDHYFLTLQQGQLLFTLIIGLSFSKVKLGIL